MSLLLVTNLAYCLHTKHLSKCCQIMQRKMPAADQLLAFDILSGRSIRSTSNGGNHNVEHALDAVAAGLVPSIMHCQVCMLCLQ